MITLSSQYLGAYRYLVGSILVLVIMLLAHCVTLFQRISMVNSKFWLYYDHYIHISCIPGCSVLYCRTVYGSTYYTNLFIQVFSLLLIQIQKCMGSSGITT